MRRLIRTVSLYPQIPEMLKCWKYQVPKNVRRHVWIKKKKKKKNPQEDQLEVFRSSEDPRILSSPMLSEEIFSSSSLEGCYLQRLSEGLWSGRQTPGISEGYIKYREIMEGYILNNAISISLSSPTYQPSIIQISLLPTSHKHEIELFEETEQTERLHIWTFPQWHGLPTLSTMC